MMDLILLGKILRAYKAGGFRTVVWRGFSRVYIDLVRPILPLGQRIVYSGEIVGRRKIGDGILPYLNDPPFVVDVPDYEQALSTALRRHVKSGDRVTIVGGGHGVTCALAARLSETGKVICFEGDLAGVEATKNTAALNGFAHRIEVVHAIVAENIGVYGDKLASISLSPAELPDCDILQLDCEGAEVQILQDMRIKPRVVAVETHAVFGAPSEKVQRVMESKGYVVENLGWAEPRLIDTCMKNGVEVLVGVREAR